MPIGPEILMEPDDPKLVHYVQQVLRPKIHGLGTYDTLDVPRNQLVVRWGERRSMAGPTLMMLVYTPTQHHDLMAEPFSGKVARAVEWGYTELCVFGQEVTQNKCHHAVMLAVLKWLVERDVQLRGTVYFAVNNEGRSSHTCSQAILAALDRKPDFAILLERV